MPTADIASVAFGDIMAPCYLLYRTDMSGQPQRLVLDGGQLKRLRVESGRRQLDVAAATDLTPSRLRQLEQGGQNTRLDTLGRLSELFEVAPEELLTWA